MKVICVDNKIELVGTTPTPCPKFGDIDTVIFSGNERDLGDFYCFERFGIEYGFSTFHFIPVSDINETEFVRNYSKELTP